MDDFCDLTTGRRVVGLRHRVADLAKTEGLRSGDLILLATDQAAIYKALLAMENVISSGNTIAGIFKAEREEKLSK